MMTTNYKKELKFKDCTNYTLLCTVMLPSPDLLIEGHLFFSKPADNPTTDFMQGI